MYDLHGLQADGDDALEKFERVSRISDCLDCIAVCVFDDAASFVGFHALALHHPVERGLAVDHIVIGLQRNTGDSNVAVVGDCRLVRLQLAFIVARI